MKILIAPDSFKGSLSALEVGEAIRQGILKIDAGIETLVLPMADGGEGTVQSLVDASGGKIVKASVHDPLYRKIESYYGILGDGKTAVIEMAAASGLPLLKPSEKNPFRTTTFGTGELIKDAIERGCREIILGIGGSATNDGGTGMAKALGFRFLKENGEEISFGAAELSMLHSIDDSAVDPGIKEVNFISACDVDNPLCGDRGASAVYGPQKGAGDEDIPLLDNGLAHLAGIVKSSMGLDLKDYPGSGAAGGLGFGVMVFLGGKLERGIDIVCDLTDLEEKMDGASLVITGEGMIDSQTASGKTPFGVARRAKERNIPVIGIAGSLGENYQQLYKMGFTSIISIIDKPLSLEKAIENTAELLTNSTESAIRLWLSGK